MTSDKILGIIKPFNNNSQLLNQEQTAGDIIKAIVNAHKLHANDYKKISSFFYTESAQATAKKIFDFLKNNVPYSIEPGNRQTVKSPAGILTTPGDCKHYALFAGGVLQQLGIPFSFRFASYKLFDNTPQHVFVVVNPGTKNEIWIDPVLKNFDQKKRYTFSTDKKMALYSLSGIGATKAQKQALKQAKTTKKAALTKAAKKAANIDVKAAKKAAGKTVGQKLKKGAKIVLKVAASPARNSFLLLVKINFANLAKKLSAAWEKEPSKIRIFWESIGGQINSLKKAWETGKNKKRIGCTDNQIGVAPAAAAVAAAPIIAKIAQVLKDLGIDPAELLQIGKDAINEKAQILAKKVLEPAAGKNAAIQENADKVFDNDEPGPITESYKTPKKNNTGILIAAAAIGAVFIFSKK